MGNPYCADIITNSSAQHSSNSKFWSLALSWLKDGIDLVHRTAKNSSLAADSKTTSWLDDELLVDVVARRVWMVRISSELLTSSSLPVKSLTPFGSVKRDNGFGFSLISSDSFFDANGEINRHKYGLESKLGLIGNVELPEISGGGGGNRPAFEAAKCNESMTFDWKAFKCG